MKLRIDTTNSRKTKIELIQNGGIKKLEAENELKSQATLILIKKIMKDSNVSLNEIKEINVNAGPGSFTGIRVGIAIANALGYALKLKVNGKNPGQLKAIYK